MNEKDQLNQNPEAETVMPQEENSSINKDASVEETPTTQVETPAMEEKPAVEMSFLDKVTASINKPTPPAEEKQEAPQVELKKEEVPSEVIVEEEVKETIKEEALSEITEEAEVKETTEEILEEEVAAVATTEETPTEEVEEIKPVKEKKVEEKIDEAALENEYKLLDREGLVMKIEELVQEEKINSALVKTHITLVRSSFIEKDKANRLELKKAFDEAQASSKDDEKIEGTFRHQKDEFNERFDKAMKVFKERRQKYIEELEKLKVENLAKKKAILEDIKGMISSEEPLAKTYETFQHIQERWREIGMVPKNETNELWNNYNFLVEKFFEKVKINKELKDIGLRKNLEAKVALCERAEALIMESSINKSFKELQQLHDSWKEVGPVPSDRNDEIWERFKSATDRINLRRREYYDKLTEEQTNNLEAKKALCEKAEEILGLECNSINIYNVHTDQLNELMKVWKTIGPAPRKDNDEIWDRFRGCMNTFFDNKKEYFGKLKEEQQINYNQKVNLCVQAEAIQNSTEWRETTYKLKDLQFDWKKIGPVPRKQSDEVWKRFRTACDVFFNTKADFYANIDKIEEDNKALKEALIKSVLEYQFTDDKDANFDIIKNFQREAMKIGQVPYKEKNNLNNEFRKAIAKRLDEMNINPVEVDTWDFKSRLESINDDPNSYRMFNQERIGIKKQIDSIEKNIQLWENNIGFLANSRNADLLKSEFDKKIMKAKDEKKILEAKLRMILKQINTKND